MTARRPASLDDVQVGDEVAVMPAPYGGAPRIGRVECVTKAQLVVSGTRFNRGPWFVEYGAGARWSRRHLKPLDDAILAQIDKAWLRFATASLADDIRKCALTRSQIRAIRAVLEGGE